MGQTLVDPAGRPPRKSPHSRQNFARGGFSCWHPGHCIRGPPAGRAGESRGAWGESSRKKAWGQGLQPLGQTCGTTIERAPGREHRVFRRWFPVFCHFPKAFPQAFSKRFHHPEGRRLFSVYGIRSTPCKIVSRWRRFSKAWSGAARAGEVPGSTRRRRAISGAIPLPGCSWGDAARPWRHGRPPAPGDTPQRQMKTLPPAHQDRARPRSACHGQLTGCVPSDAAGQAPVSATGSVTHSGGG